MWDLQIINGQGSCSRTIWIFSLQRFSGCFLAVGIPALLRSALCICKAFCCSVVRCLSSPMLGSTSFLFEIYSFWSNGSTFKIFLQGTQDTEYVYLQSQGGHCSESSDDSLGFCRLLPFLCSCGNVSCLWNMLMIPAIKPITHMTTASQAQVPRLPAHSFPTIFRFACGDFYCLQLVKYNWHSITKRLLTESFQSLFPQKGCYTVVY